MTIERIWRADQFFLVPVIVIPFTLVFIAVLNDFYRFGDMGDIGWFASAAWHNGLALQGPPSHDFSFFNVHIVPILWLTNLVSLCLPLSKIDYWAALNGTIYALFGTGIYRLWLIGREAIRPEDRAAAVLVALAASFSAIGVQALRIPHLEMGIPALGLWFFLCLAERRIKSASVFFFLCLLVREDAGLHLFGLLALLFITLKIWGRVALRTEIARFGVLALFYAALALTLKYRFFMAMDNMAIVYSGEPPWHHLTWGLISERLLFLLESRTYIMLPFFIAVGWALFVRNPLIPVGSLAALPWLIWNLMAVRPNPGHLDFYYGFPFWLALAWPLVALALWRAGGRPSVQRRWPYVLILCASLAGWQNGGLAIYPFSSRGVEMAPNRFEGSPFETSGVWGREKAYRGFETYFGVHQTAFSGAAMDSPVLGLVIDDNKEVPWIGDWNALQPNALPRMIIYYDQAFEWGYWVRPTLRAYRAQFPYFYQVPGTAIRVAAVRPLEEILPVPMPFVATESPDF